MEPSLRKTTLVKRRGDVMDISDESSNAPTLVTASSPSRTIVTRDETWPSPSSSTLPGLPLHPRIISFAKPLNKANNHFPQAATVGLRFTFQFLETAPTNWLLQTLQKRLRPEDIPCIPSTQRQYRKRYRLSNGDRRDVRRPPLCLFLNYFDRTRPSARPVRTLAAKAMTEPKKNASPLVRPKPLIAPKVIEILDDEDSCRPSWNDIVSQTVPEDEDSDCFSLSSIDATFEMHHYAEDALVTATLQLPVLRCNRTKVKQTASCNNTSGENGTAPMRLPLVENDSPRGKL